MLEGKIYRDQIVDLTGLTVLRCEFVNCTFIGVPSRMENCRLINCTGADPLPEPFLIVNV
jgi:hypothetical protein